MQPVQADPGVGPGVGMDHVISPFFGRDSLDLAINPGLEGDQNGVKIFV